MDSLCTKSATDLAGLIRKKETSSKEVVEAHLNRILEVNPYLNAVTLTLEESALKAAERADNASEADRKKPFHGVPFTIKENIDFYDNVDDIDKKRANYCKDFKLNSLNQELKKIKTDK